MQISFLSDKPIQLCLASMPIHGLAPHILTLQESVQFSDPSPASQWDHLPKFPQEPLIPLQWLPEARLSIKGLSTASRLSLGMMETGGRDYSLPLVVLQLLHPGTVMRTSSPVGPFHPNPRTPRFLFSPELNCLLLLVELGNHLCCWGSQ